MEKDIVVLSRETYDELIKIRDEGKKEFEKTIQDMVGKTHVIEFVRRDRADIFSSYYWYTIKPITEKPEKKKRGFFSS